MVKVIGAFYVLVEHQYLLHPHAGWASPFFLDEKRGEKNQDKKNASSHWLTPSYFREACASAKWCPTKQRKAQ